MKKKNNIEEWYKNELNNYKVEPDKSGWEKLSSAMDHPAQLSESAFDEFVKEEMELITEQPDKVVWDKLSEKLDLATVWDRLAVSLTHYERWLWWKNTLFKTAAVLVFMLGIGVSLNNYLIDKPKLYQHNTKNTAVKITPVKSPESKVAINIPKEVHEKERFATNEISHKNQKRKSSELFSTSKNNQISEATSNISKANSKLNICELSDYSKGELLAVNHTYSLTPTIAKEFLIKKENNKIIFNNKRFSSHFAFGIYAKRIYFGFNAGFKKQSMITQLKNNGMYANLKQQTLLDHGTSFGFTTGIILSDKMNLETNVNLYSSSGYRKKFYSTENSFAEKQRLTYSNISLLAKRMYNKSTFDDKKYSTNFMGGIYVGFLRHAVVANGSQATVEQYNNLDAGIVLGIEQDRYITKELVITPGIRYYQGAKNIATEKSPFQYAYNSALEFNIALKYIFLKRN